LVAAGDFIVELARTHDCMLLPVDSEHNAVFQIFDEDQKGRIEKIILTASGGPFLNWTQDAMAQATVAQALAHPNWSMGDKISIDSATMMNKALEVIEARYLFDVVPEKIDVVVHPQSVVHSMVEYCDGSVLAQMGASDMCTPLANILAWPARLKTPGKRLDVKALLDINFQAPDLEKFPALGLAYDCMQRGHYACVALNAANEVAVAAFLAGEISFGMIVDVVCDIVEQAQSVNLPTIKDILSYDEDIRRQARHYISKHYISKRSNNEKEAARA